MHTFWTWTKRYYSGTWSRQDDEESLIETPKDAGGRPRSLSMPAVNRPSKRQHKRSAAIDLKPRSGSFADIFRIRPSEQASPVVSTVPIEEVLTTCNQGDRAASEAIAPDEDEDDAPNWPPYPEQRSKLQDYVSKSDVRGILRLNEAVMCAAEDLAPGRSKKLVHILEEENQRLVNGVRIEETRRKDSKFDVGIPHSVAGASWPMERERGRLAVVNQEPSIGRLSEHTAIEEEGSQEAPKEDSKTRRRSISLSLRISPSKE